MKKVLSLLLVIVLTMPFFSCGRKEVNIGSSIGGQSDTSLIYSDFADQDQNENDSQIQSNTSSKNSSNKSDKYTSSMITIGINRPTSSEKEDNTSSKNSSNKSDKNTSSTSVGINKPTSSEKEDNTSSEKEDNTSSRIPLSPTPQVPQAPSDTDKVMQRFLCWDNTAIAESNGLTVLQNKPQKQNIALDCDDIWEGVHNCYATVIQVGDTYRLYYRAAGQKGDVYPENNGATDANLVCVAESKDGINFTKPIINQIEYNGSKQNNIVFSNSASFTIFYDTNPDCPKDEKFKALSQPPKKEQLHYYCSADGYSFKYVNSVKLSDGIYDSYNAAYWDEDAKVYKLYYRGWHHPDGTTIPNGGRLDAVKDIRDVRLAVSKDFRTWQHVGIVELPGYTNLQMYTNQIAPYYRERNTFLGFPARYMDRSAEKDNFNDMPIADARDPALGRTVTAITDCGIMTSTDGLTFNLRKSAFMTPGPETNTNWWYGDGYTAYGMVETLSDDGVNREISMYVGEGYRLQKVDFRRYTIRLDGFFSWYGDGDGATVTTKAFTLKHDEMFVNFATSALGSLKITVLDKNGKAIDGYKSNTLFGDSTNRPVRFTKPLKDLVGQEIKLKIELNDCNLYSYTFE